MASASPVSAGRRDAAAARPAHASQSAFSRRPRQDATAGRPGARLPLLLALVPVCLDSGSMASNQAWPLQVLGYTVQAVQQYADLKPAAAVRAQAVPRGPPQPGSVPQLPSPSSPGKTASFTMGFRRPALFAPLLLAAAALAQQRVCPIADVSALHEMISTTACCTYGTPSLCLACFAQGRFGCSELYSCWC